MTTTGDVVAIDYECSLREAIISANTNPSAVYGGECEAGSPGMDTIVLPAGTYALTITNGATPDDTSAKGDLDITDTVAIQGTGVGDTGTTVDAGGIDRVFDILAPVVTFEKMQIVGGNLTSAAGVLVHSGSAISMDRVLLLGNFSTGAGGALYIQSGGTATLSNASFANNSASYGGGIYNLGTLALTSSSLTWNNTASFDGGAIHNGGTATLTDVTISNASAASAGGAIYQTGPLVMNRVTLANNQATGGKGGGYGGAIYAIWPMTLTNVTISENTALVSGGGIYKINVSNDMTLIHTTFYSNSAWSGGNISRSGTNGSLVLRSSVLYSGASGGNCGGSPINSQGYNLESANTCGLNATGDISNTNPLLGPLASNGGSTQTHRLLPGSPAIDRIPVSTNGCGTSVFIDQRGMTRPMGNRCDLGAYEMTPTSFLPLIFRLP